MADDVKQMKLAALKQLDARSIDADGFRTALVKFQANITDFFRVVSRDRDAVDVAAGHYLPRRKDDPGNAPQASIQTSDIDGMEKYLLGRSLADHQDFQGLDGPFEGKVEAELLQPDGSWINALTGEVTQADSGAMPEPLFPPQQETQSIQEQLAKFTSDELIAELQRREGSPT